MINSNIFSYFCVTAIIVLNNADASYGQNLGPSGPVHYYTELLIIADDDHPARICMKQVHSTAFFIQRDNDNICRRNIECRTLHGPVTIDEKPRDRTRCDSYTGKHACVNGECLPPAISDRVVSWSRQIRERSRQTTRNGK